MIVLEIVNFGCVIFYFENKIKSYNNMMICKFWMIFDIIFVFIFYIVYVIY